MQPNEPKYCLTSYKEAVHREQWAEIVWDDIKHKYSKPQLIFSDKIEGNIFTATNIKHDYQTLFKSYGFKE